jgi:archaellum component FlaC
MNHLTLSERQALKLLYGNSDLAGGDIIRALIDEIETLERQIKSCRQIVESVAHVGINFGQGPWEIQQSEINDARKLLEELDKAALTQEQERGQ